MVLKSELSVLKSALDFFEKKEALAITHKQVDTFDYKGRKMELTPAWNPLILASS